MSVNSSTLVSSGVPATKIIDGVKASEAITVEAWITPASNPQYGPARIVTLSDGSYERNMTLGQIDGVYQTRLRTTTAGENGTNPYVQTPSSIGMSLVNPTHVVYTRDASGNAITYVDGVAVVIKTIGGSVSNWDDTMQFALANELGTDRHWLGKLFHVAVYDRALSAAEVTQNMNVGVIGTCGQAPSANFSFTNGTGDVEYTFDFDASASFDADGSIVSYAWDFGDDAAATGVNVSHVYASAGQYTVTLVTTDDQGITDQAVHTVVVLGSGRVVQDQVLFYNFSEGTGTTVNDLSGVGTPVNLTIPDASKVSWLSCGGLSVDEATFISAASSPLKMIDAVQASNELTIEAWVTPENITQSGPARMVTYSLNGSKRNFTLGQDAANYDVRLRTTSTNENGISPNLSSSGNDVTTTLTHIVYTRDTLGQAKLYSNGNLIKTATIGSSTDNWDNSHVFGLANENGTDRSWLGEIHLVAVYSRALVQQEVEQNFLQGGGDACSNVNAAPVLTAIADQSVLENTTATISLNASDADNDVLTFSVTGLPSFATFTGSVITVAPNFDAAGTYGPITVSVTDGTDIDSTTFSLTTTNNNQSPEITSTPITVIAEGQGYQYNVAATDNDGDTLTYSLGVAPSGMSVNPLSGLIVWEPDFTSAGAELVIVNVTDGLKSVQQSYTLTINNTNQVPVINSVPVMTASENVAYQYIVSASDADGDALTYSLAVSPSGMDISLMSGVIVWIPDLNAAGTELVVVDVFDGQQGVQQSFILTIASANHAPNIISESVTSVLENAEYQYSVIATDVDGDALTYGLAKFPDGMQIDEVTGEITWSNFDGYVLPDLDDNLYCKASGISVSNEPILEMIMAIDVSASMSGEWEWVDSLVPNMEFTLLLNDVGAQDRKNLYGAVGFVEEVFPQPVADEFTGTAYDLVSYQDLAQETGYSEDGWKAINYILNSYEFSQNAYRTILLITDEGRAKVDTELDFELMASALIQNDVVLNVVVKASFECPDGSQAMGLNESGVGFVPDGDGGYLTCDNASITASAGNTNTNYIQLAFETGGTAWDVMILRENDNSSVSLSKAIVEVQKDDVVEQLSDVELHDLSIVDATLEGDNVVVNIINRGLVSTNSVTQLHVMADGIELGTLLLDQLDVGQQKEFQVELTESIVAGNILQLTITSETADCQQLNDDASFPLVEVFAVDLQGALSTQDFLINVRGIDHDFTLQEVEDLALPVGAIYLQQITVLSAEIADSYLYTLVAGPSGMMIDAYSGQLNYVVAEQGIGSHSVVVEVSDFEGNVHQVNWQLTIYNDSQDGIMPPKITSNAQFIRNDDDVYFYQMAIAAEDNSTVVYEIVDSPSYCEISTTGLITCDLNEEAFSSLRWVFVKVSDSYGRDVQVIPINVAPDIISEAPIAITAGHKYAYSIKVNDFEKHQVSYFLDKAPTGMVVSKSGAITWPENDVVVGAYDVVIRVEDQFQAISAQSYILTVLPNSVPVIASTPVIALTSGHAYSYKVLATDEDDDKLSYTLLSAPDDMTISAYGTINWTSPQYVSGSYPVSVEVNDGYGGVASQTFAIIVNYNNSPVVTSQPVVEAITGHQYKYRILATDVEGDNLQYDLISAPNDMSISLSYGTIKWTPSLDNVGGNPVEATVSDGYGGVTTHSFVVVVAENQSPVISSVPLPSVIVGESYYSKVVATDVENDSLKYSFNLAPDGLTISYTGVMKWTPSLADAGFYPVVVYVSDESGGSVEQLFELGVYGPLLTLFQVPESGSIVEGEHFFSQVRAIHPSDIEINYSILSGPDSMQIDMLTGDVNWETGSGDVGVHDIVVQASSADGQVDTREFSITVEEVPVAPQISIVNLAYAQSISAPTEVVISVSDTNIEHWKLVYQSRSQSSPELLVLAEGDSNVDNLSVATFDTTGLVNGQYLIILEATDEDGLTAQKDVSVIVEGELKIGDFSFSVTDLDVPMEGLPIRVTRSYDSRKKQEDSGFGFGWNIDYQNVKVEESRAPGLDWTMNHYYVGPYGTVVEYCVEPNQKPIVTVTLPDGQVERFNVTADPACNTYVPVLDVELKFNPIGDTDSELQALDNYFGRLVGGHLVDVTSLNVINPQHYTLTTKSGYVYHLDQEFGIESVETPNGHTITYTDDGIYHSGGKSILFGRDEFDRINNITGPTGVSVMTYVYDTAGDLRYAKDSIMEAAGSEGIQYVYNSFHTLVDIFDPLNRQVLRNLYDDDGVLFGQQNGAGDIKYFDHNITDRTTVVTDLDGRVTHFNYDDYGNVLEDIKIITDNSYAADIVTSYTYDGNNNQETKTVGDASYVWISEFDEDNNQLFAQDPEGHRVRYENYNLRGQETEVYDEMDRKTVMHYDTAGNLYQIDMPDLINPDTNDTSLLFASNIINEKGQVSRTTDLRGQVTDYEYYPKGHDSEGQKWTESNVISGTTTYTYDDNNNVITEMRERTVNTIVVTESVSYDYDVRDRLTKTTYPDTTYTETQYDLAGNPDKERDRFGVWTDFDYDVYGRLILTTYVDETTEVRAYSNEGLLESVTDRMGRVTTYEYDDASRLWKTTFDDGSYTETKYTPQGWVQFEWDEKRNLTEYEYFLNGRRKAVIRHLGTDKIRHEYTYYANGELQTETDPLGRVTTYSINEFDQRISTLFHNGTTVGQRYDAMGARTKQIDQNGRSTRYGYDDLGRLETVTPEVTINGVAVPDTSYTYDEVGNKLTQTDAEGRTTTWTYDYYGRVLTRTLPELMSESFVYDDVLTNGLRTVAHTDFNGDTNITYIDNQGRVDHIDYHDGTSEAYTYWANGQVHTVTDQHGTTETVFDVRDRLDYEIKPDGTRLDYAYDDVGNREQVKVTRGTIITVTDYTFDVLNRLDTVTDASGVTSYTYYDNGSLWTVTFPNGVVSEYFYNDVNQLEVLTTKDKDGVVLSSYTYGLDDTGRRDDITEADGRFTDYTYDNLYRLTDEVVTESGLEVYNANYIYDWVGNRKYETITDGSTVQTAYAYDLNDRLTSQGGTVYVHDDNGNTLTETLDGVVTTYSYDAKNKMTSVDKGGVVTGYAYDANGIRTSKTEAGLTTNFVVDLNRDYAQVLEEVVGDIETAAASVVYTYGHDLLNQGRAGEFRFYSYDGLGSTRALTDAAGVITDEYDYSAFGGVLNSSGESVNAYKYTGEQEDAETGNYYLRARYLNTGIGRFTQQDTYMGDDYNPITLHKYLYANASPGMYVDPTGNFALMTQMQAMQVSAILNTTAYAAVYLGGLDSSYDGVSGSGGLRCANRILSSKMGARVPATSDKDKECDDNLNTMRLQLQQGSAETWSAVRVAGSKKGVTARDMQGALRQLLTERAGISWFPGALDKWLNRSIIEISRNLNLVAMSGGISRNGTIESLKRETWNRRKEFRLEIENLRGTNLKHID